MFLLGFSHLESHLCVLCPHPSSAARWQRGVGLATHSVSSVHSPVRRLRQSLDVAGLSQVNYTFSTWTLRVGTFPGCQHFSRTTGFCENVK